MYWATLSVTLSVLYVNLTLENCTQRSMTLEKGRVCTVAPPGCRWSCERGWGGTVRAAGAGGCSGPSGDGGLSHPRRSSAFPVLFVGALGKIPLLLAWSARLPYLVTLWPRWCLEGRSPVFRAPPHPGALSGEPVDGRGEGGVGVGVSVGIPGASGLRAMPPPCEVFTCSGSAHGSAPVRMACPPVTVSSSAFSPSLGLLLGS